VTEARFWPPGTATGLGSLPYLDSREAMRLILGELPELPHLPELPSRGAGADLIGRGALLLADLAVEIQPSGWRITARPGRDMRRARDLLARDLDAMEELAGGHTGAFKVQVAGPWTLAAGIELPSGHRVLADHGATRDLVQSLTEGVRTHLADVATRLPNARIVVQVDEPTLPSVLAGHVPTASGYGTLRTVAASTIEQALADVLAVVPVGARVVHCCAAEVPVPLLRRAGADAIALDAARLTSRHYDDLGEVVQAGASLWLGVVPGTDADISFASARAIVAKLWSALGFPADQLAATVVPTPACGLAGASPAYVRRALKIVRETGRAFAEGSEEDGPTAAEHADD
jgi:Cobalamin-independent synthase, Catalytic domain